MPSYPIRHRRATPAVRLAAYTLTEPELVELGRAAALAVALDEAIADGENGKVLRRLSFGLLEALADLHRGAEPHLYAGRTGA